ncbi:MAG: hypothetical protein QOH95_2770, partial [Gaiellaceae bacterium]|nr:hypothetical protein [Gaiellaceae bacterium]
MDEGSGVSNALVQSTLLGELLDNAKIGALAIESGHYVAANGYACELTGYARADLIGRRVGELDPFSSLPGQFAEDPNRPRGAGVLTIRRKDGEELKVDYWAVDTMLSGLPL